MSDREILLGNLVVGDIFHAEYPNGAKCICLVMSVNDTIIQAKRITSQDILQFDRRTGIEKVGEEDPVAIINSVAPLPTEIHDTFLELDRKYKKYTPDQDPEQFKLTETEKKALRFIHSHYASNPLPPVDHADDKLVPLALRR